jgi:hypothetical protein
MIRKEQENSAANLLQCFPSFHFLLLSILVSSFHLPILLKLSDHAVWRIHFIRILQSSMVSVKAKLIQG